MRAKAVAFLAALPGNGARDAPARAAITERRVVFARILMLYLHTSGPSVAAGEFDDITAACRWIHQIINGQPDTGLPIRNPVAQAFGTSFRCRQIASDLS